MNTKTRAVHDHDQFDPRELNLHRATRLAGAVRLTEITPAPIHWLWPGRIPLGYVTLLVSDPGAGKSLVALDIAARVTTARQWPDEPVKSQETRVKSQHPDSESTSGSSPSTLDSRLPPSGPRPSTLDPRPPFSVLLLNIEDHFANTVRPRLDALGADCSRILGISHVPGDGIDGTHRPLAVNRDINRIAMLLREIPDCRLIILDPITAFFGDSSNRATGNIWKVLINLSWLAASADLAVLAISHLRKKEGAPLHRALGSMAYMAAARAAWTICPDPDHPSRRLFLPLKNNLAESAGGLAFTIETHPSGAGPVVRWLSDSIDARASAVLAPHRQPGRFEGEREFAVRWLRHHLAERPLQSREVRKAADANGISAGTLRRAFRDLGAVAYQPKNVLHGPWLWKLPDQMRKSDGGDFCATDQFIDEFAEVVSK
jgi:putative DNA primase/helicase